MLGNSTFEFRAQKQLSRAQLFHAGGLSARVTAAACGAARGAIDYAQKKKEKNMVFTCIEQREKGIKCTNR